MPIQACWGIVSFERATNHMDERHERDSLIRGTADEPLTSRPNKSTLVGCVGILLVLSLPALLFLPLERLHIPMWLGNLIPFLAVGTVAIGVCLLIRVPSEAPTRSYDPHYPLTSTGKSPVLEQPAERSNRLILLLGYGLMLSAMIGYAIVSFVGQPIGIAIGTLLVSAGGYGLLVGGVLAARRQIPAPAWRWVRMPVQGTVALQALPMMILGMVTAIWALVLGVEYRYFLLPLGFGLLILGGLVLGVLLLHVANYYQRAKP